MSANSLTNSPATDLWVVTFDFSNKSPPPDQKVADDPMWDLNPPNPLSLIIRATDGHSRSEEGVRNKDKVKLSTVVRPDELDAFFARYADVCKAGMQSLKKRDRSKRKKDKKGKKKVGSATEGGK